MSGTHHSRTPAGHKRQDRPMIARTLLALVLLLAGCSAAPSDVGSPAPATAADAAPKLLRFTARTLDDKDFTGESLAGKAAVLWFWAPWCPRCMGEAPHLGSLAKDQAGKVTFVGVGAQDGLPAMKKFVADNEVGGFQHLADLDASIWTRFGITQQPAYAFVRPDGNIVVVKQQLSEESLNEHVRELTAS
jgi:thiol-disulfide isomerase/thioredoxin